MRRRPGGKEESGRNGVSTVVVDQSGCHPLEQGNREKKKGLEDPPRGELGSGDELENCCSEV